MFSFALHRVAISSLTSFSTSISEHLQYVNSRTAARVASHILRWSGAHPSAASVAADLPAGLLGSAGSWERLFDAALAARLGSAAGRRRLEQLRKVSARLEA